MDIYGIETGYYMGESYQERLNKITDRTAVSAFQEAYAKKMAGVAVFFLQKMITGVNE